MDGVMTEPSRRRRCPERQDDAHHDRRGSDPGRWITSTISGLPFPAMPPEAQVALILVKYALLGVMPMVIPSVLIDIPLPIDRIPRQKGTDLKHIRRLANLVGYVFYLDPGPHAGHERRLLGSADQVGPVQPALAVDADASTNVEHLQFTFDNDRKTLPILIIQEPTTKIPIPIAVGDITPLNPPLGAHPADPEEDRDLTVGAAKWSAMRAALIALAKASKGRRGGDGDAARSTCCATDRC